MSRILWNASGQRRYDFGLDRGVLYVHGHEGVPWNGLIQADRGSTGGEVSSYYMDGAKFHEQIGSEDFSGSIEAYTYPDEFELCEGLDNDGQGLSFGLQPRKPFDLTYRTKIATDLDPEEGYKLHFIYNARVLPNTHNSKTVNENVDPDTFSWNVTSTPIRIPDRRPTSYFSIDSRKTDPHILATIEGIIYGGPNFPPTLLTPHYMMSIFDSWEAIDEQISITFKGYLGEPKQIINVLPNPNFRDTSPSRSTTSYEVRRRNYVPNPWPTNVPGTWERAGVASTLDMNGDRAMLTLTAATTSSWYRLIMTGMIPITPDEPYSARCQVYSSVAGNVTLQVQEFDEAGNWINDGSRISVPVAADTWTAISAEEFYPISPNAKNFKFAVTRSGQAAPIGARLGMRRAQLERAVTIEGYFDGNSQPFNENLWTVYVGAASNSISELRGRRAITEYGFWPNRCSRYVQLETGDLIVSRVLSGDAGCAFRYPERLNGGVGTMYTILAEVTSSVDALTVGIHLTSGGVTGAQVSTPIGVRTWVRVKTTLTNSSTQGVTIFALAGKGKTGDLLFRLHKILVVEGDYNGNFFDGDVDSVMVDNQKTLSRWEGVPDKSPSIIDYLSPVPENPTPGDSYILGKNYWVYDGAIWRNTGQIID